MHQQPVQEQQHRTLDPVEPRTHTHVCPFFLHGGVCSCGVIDPELFAHVADAVYPDGPPDA